MLVFNSTRPADLAALGDALLAVHARLDAQSRGELTALAHGRSLDGLAKALHAAADPDAIRAAAELLAANEGGCACSGDEPPEPTSEQIDDAADRMAREALKPFAVNPSLVGYLRARLAAT